MSRHGSGRGPGGADLGLGTLFEALGEAVAEVTRRLEDGQTGEIHRSYDVETGKGPVRAEAGIRVRFADASAGAEERGVRPVNRPGPPAKTSERASPGDEPASDTHTPKPVRTIEYTVFEDAAGWRLTADLPGVGAPDLVLSDADGNLIIETTGARHYRATVALPESVCAADLEVRVNNGILVLRYAPDDGA